MAKAQWTPLAEAELDDILYYIATEGGRPETAERLYVELRAAVDEHAAAGGPHHRHPSMPADWAYLRFKRWLIAYEPVDDTIIARRVLDASRDLPPQFEPW